MASDGNWRAAATAKLPRRAFWCTSAPKSASDMTAISLMGTSSAQRSMLKRRSGGRLNWARGWVKGHMRSANEAQEFSAR